MIMMKKTMFQRSKTTKPIIALLLLFFLSNLMQAQGWSFTFSVTSSGPCGATLPYIQPFTIPYLSTQGQCESLRQTILSIRVSQPMYDEHGSYIGDCSVFYTATPCTGADISTSGGEFSPGSVSIDGLLQGSAFFTPHETKELENWMNDYLVKMKSMGVTIEPDYSFTIQDIPLTGDKDFDEFYVSQIIDFEKPEQGGTVYLNEPSANTSPEPGSKTDEELGTTVQLLRTNEDIAREEQWLAEHDYFSVSQIGPDNTLDAGGNDPAEITWGEAVVREYVGNNLAGSLALKFVDNTMEGVQEVTQSLTSGDFEGAAEKGINLSENVAKTSTVDWAKDQATDLITGAAVAPVLGLVKNADVVVSVINTFGNIWDTKHGK